MYKFKELYPLIIDEINENRNVAVRIHGKSMCPLFKDNTKVLLTKIDVIKNNDIIFYKRDNDEFVIHRVIKITDTLTFIGDHQTIEESNIRLDQCFAKAIGYYKKDKLKEFKGILYNLYLITLKSKFIRRIYGKF